MSTTQCLDNSEVENAAATYKTVEIRVEKILSIRRQLGEGRYRIAPRLDVVIDRILEQLLEQ
jgi:hypothetical protein